MKETSKQNDYKKQIEDNELKWYTLSVVSGQESIVVENLKERVKKQSLEKDIADFLVPMAQESKIKDGKKKTKQVKLYPGYVFVKSKMNEKIWYIIRNTPGVRLIVGAETVPVPLSDKEYQDIMRQIEEQNETSEYYTPFKEGDIVILHDENFDGMKGVVKEVDAPKGLVNVNIEILGRLTPVILAFDKVKLAD